MKSIITTVAIMIISVSMMVGQTKTRPNECWVRRSVLDKKARVITVALHKNLYVAYDGNTGGIFKVWNGGVEYTGTVWNTKHGPQPVSLGNVYTLGLEDKQVWYLQKNGTDLPTTVKFKGYVWKDNIVTFKYELIADNAVVQIEETPEYVTRAADNMSGLERKVKIYNLPVGFSVYALVRYDNLLKREDVVTDGTLKKVSQTEKFLENNTTLFDLTARVFIKPMGTTTVTAYYSPKILN